MATTALLAISQLTAYYDNLINLLPVDYYYPDYNKPALDTTVQHYKSTKRKHSTLTTVTPAVQYTQRTVTDVQRKLEQLAAAKQHDYTVIAHTAKRQATHKTKHTAANDADNATDTAAADADDTADTDMTDGAEQNNTAVENTANNGTVTIESLRQRLQAKIAALAPKRRTDKQLTDADKAALKQKLNAEKLKHKHMLQQQRKTQKQAHTDKHSDTNAVVHNTASGGTVSAQRSGRLNEADVQYSQFKVADTKHSGAVLEGEQLRSGTNKQSAKQQLNALQQYNAKLAQLRAAGQTEQADALVKQSELQHALLRAQGVAVRDNAALLNKAIKRKESQKSKSARGWQDRLKQQRVQAKERDAKKQENIEKRLKTSKKGKKSKVGSAPGFGSTGKFINS